MRQAIDRTARFAPAAFALLVIAVIMTGWRLRDYHLVTAERGMGYVFGIVGFSLMSMLMLYPLRKRVRWLALIGDVKTWFRIHMLLGVIGPVFILFHCNFQLGSFNSNVALFSMLVVSSSGIFGRYFYSRIHHGLYGQRATLLDLRAELEEQKEELAPQLDLIPGMRDTLYSFSDKVIKPPRSLMEGIRNRASIDWKFFRLRRSVKRMVQHYLRTFSTEHHWSRSRRHKMKKQMLRKANQVMRQTRKVAEFGFYERLFVLWHIFHIPLVYMLFIAAVIHIVAVHLY